MAAVLVVAALCLCLMPVASSSDSIVGALVSQDGRFSAMAELLDEVDLLPLLDSWTRNGGDLTFFFPSDDSLRQTEVAKVTAYLRRPAQQAVLRQLLLCHIAPTLVTADAFQRHVRLATLEDHDVRDLQLGVTPDGTLMAGDSAVLRLSALEAAGGVVHEVASLMIPSCMRKAALLGIDTGAIDDVDRRQLLGGQGAPVTTTLVLSPSLPPTEVTVMAPDLSSPSDSPSFEPAMAPSSSPAISPAVPPATSPSLPPSFSPHTPPSLSPSSSPSISPSASPSLPPSVSPPLSPFPSLSPAFSPSPSPDAAPSLAPSPYAPSPGPSSGEENLTDLIIATLKGQRDVFLNALLNSTLLGDNGELETALKNVNIFFTILAPADSSLSLAILDLTQTEILPLLKYHILVRNYSIVDPYADYDNAPPGPWNYEGLLSLGEETLSGGDPTTTFLEGERVNVTEVGGRLVIGGVLLPDSGGDRLDASRATIQFLNGVLSLPTEDAPDSPPPSRPPPPAPSRGHRQTPWPYLFIASLSLPLLLVGAMARH